MRWLHAGDTPLLKWYGAHDKRGHIAMDAFGILPKIDGVAVQDGRASYREYGCLNGLCKTHHLTGLIYLEEITAQTWMRFGICRSLNPKSRPQATSNPRRRPADRRVESL